MSRISTESTDTPQSAVLRPISSRNCRSPCLRSASSVDSSAEPTISRSELCALGIVDLPEHHGIDVHRHGISAQCRFGPDLGGLDALVEPGGHAVDEGYDDKHSGTADGIQ